MRIIVFLSHPIQYYSPLWKEIARRPGVELKVCYFSKRSLEPAIDPDFKVTVAWDIDLLDGYDSEFLERCWPTADPLDHGPKAINVGFKRILGDQQWDVAIVSGYAHRNNWRIAQLCKRYKIPLMCFSDTSMLAEGVKPPLKRFVKGLVLRRFIAMTSMFLPCSSHAADHFLHYGARKENITVTPFVVDCDRFITTVANTPRDKIQQLREQYGIDSDKIYVVFSGKLTAGKRPEDILAAVRILNRTDVAVLLLGSGSREEYLRQVAPAGTVFAGFVNQQNMPLLLSFGRIMVLSSAKEAYGIAPVEGMALGLPAVVSDHCGCWGPTNPVRDGETGFIYPCGDVDALAKYLDILISDKSLYQRMSDKAKHVALESSPSEVADIIIDAATISRKRMSVAVVK